MTLEEWIALYEVQHGVCPICLKPLPPLDELNHTRSVHDPWSTRDWNTDHCHTTGKVRAILHRRCNMGLGAFEEDPDRMERAAAYVRAHTASTR